MRFPGRHPIHEAVAVACAAMLLPIAGDLGAQMTGDRSPGQNAGVTIRGEVVDHGTGDPLRGAEISLGGLLSTAGAGTRVSGARGRFLFEGVPAGSYRLSVTMLGFQAMAITLQVPSNADLDLVLPLSTDPVRLDPIVVVSERPTPGRRATIGRGRAALTVTREQIDLRHPLYLTDLLVLVPGGRIVPEANLGSRLLLRGGCRPGIWVDGVRMPNEGLDRLISPNDVEAIEVYHGFDLPVALGSNPCGGVVIWSRLGTPPASEPSAPRSGFWRRLAFASGFVLLALAVTR